MKQITLKKMVGSLLVISILTGCGITGTHTEENTETEQAEVLDAEKRTPEPVPVASSTPEADPKTEQKLTAAKGAAEAAVNEEESDKVAQKPDANAILVGKRRNPTLKTIGKTYLSGTNRSTKTTTTYTPSAASYNANSGAVANKSTFAWDDPQYQANLNANRQWVPIPAQVDPEADKIRLAKKYSEILGYEISPDQITYTMRTENGTTVIDYSIRTGAVSSGESSGSSAPAEQPAYSEPESAPSEPTYTEHDSQTGSEPVTEPQPEPEPVPQEESSEVQAQTEGVLEDTSDN